jgi:tRNA dimethylallyltransferase
LCPSDRMDHTKVVDERCEDMICRGLLKETTDLAVSGKLPDMVTKAIGYRQALEYLSRQDATDRDESSFYAFLDAFTTATRRYARKQMLWFRKDPTFMFVPVDVMKPKSNRVLEAAIEVDRMIRMPRDEYDLERTANESVSEQTRRSTELQAKKMKTYQFQRYVLRTGSDELAAALAEADECTRRFQSDVFTDHS